MSNVQFDEQLNLDKDLSRPKIKHTVFGDMASTGLLSSSVFIDCAYGALSIIFFAYAFSLFFSTTLQAFDTDEKGAPQVDQSGYYTTLNQ